MNNYLDQYSRYHNKPVTDTDSVPTNNGWIYTAYYQKAYGSLPDYRKNIDCFVECRSFQPKRILRSPGKINPPISRDEILGLVSLSLVIPVHLNGWNFSPYPIPAFSLTKLLSQVWELRPKFALVDFPGFTIKLPDIQFRHRNYFWKNNLDQLYRFAFSVPLQDRAFILQKWGTFRWYKPSHAFYAAISGVDKGLGWFKPTAIRWLKYGEERNKAEMLKEFPEDHPIVQRFK